jgi:membrane protease YdiL (CAAX protease family)
VSREPARIPQAVETYFAESRRPWTILLFLLPAVLFYEVRLAILAARGEAVLVNKAQHGVLRFLEAIGLADAGLFALALPGAVLVGLLLIWQLLLRAPWRAAPATLGVMLAESALMAAPLLLLSTIASGSPLAATEPDWSTLGVSARIAVSLGAGIYEELVFRLLLLATLHVLLVDLLGLKSWLGSTIAVIVSAILFAAYHPLRDVAGELDWRRAAFYVAAGVWLGGLMLVRGFGIAVGAHALYDIATLLGSD